MTEKIPEDLLEKADELAQDVNSIMLAELSVRQEGEVAALIAQALMEERERATQAERERCALIAEDQTRYFWSVIGRTIAIAIRSPS